MLRAAGIPVETTAAGIDERREEDAARGEGADTRTVALRLARAKALAVSRERPGRIVLGADQTLSLGEHALHKPVDLAEAVAQLQRMAGRSHDLHAACAVARDGEMVGEAVDTATITLRPLSAAMIQRYLAAAGSDVLGSVGVYHVEALGPHLFQAVEGDHFTIMGLPLLKLLAALRNLGLVAE
jgi:septum formation protein